MTLDLVWHYISLYGYIGIYLLLAVSILGFPMLDESLLAFIGFLSSTGELNHFWTVLAAALGSMSGMTIAYLLGRFFEPRVLLFLHKHAGVASLEQVLKWYQIHGGKLLTIGYFIPGVRHLSGYVAGLSGFRYRTFAFYSYLGAVLWTTIFITLGRMVGENWINILPILHRYSLLVGVVIGVLTIIGVFIYRKYRARRS